jgi:hypothetical protein
MSHPVVHSDPDIQGGLRVSSARVFRSKICFDYLEAGDSLDQFFNDFPSGLVSRRLRH